MSKLLNCQKYQAGQCLSCTQITVDYDAQLVAKCEQTALLLNNFFQDPTTPNWLPPVASTLSGFRNRAKFVVSGSAGDLTLGLQQADGAVDLTDCPVQDPRVNNAAVVLRDFLNSLKLPGYSVKKRRGELKFVHLTVGAQDALMARFVVRSMAAAEKIAQAKQELAKLMPQLVTATINLLPEHKAVLEGEQEFVLWGSGLTVEFGDIDLRFLPQSFLQTNTVVAGDLYRQAKKWAQEIDPDSIWDLYCGVGGFALHLAAQKGHHRRVLGVELSEYAVRAAKKSARAQNLAASFIAADATQFAISSVAADHPELLVVNPPRRGIGKELTGWLENSAVKNVIYSSCNPQSLAADLKELPSWKIKEGRVFDMFAHTPHLEVAVLLERR